jgi:hypothetical protein
MTSLVSWSGRQARRLGWLAQDLGFCAQAVLRAERYARGSDEPAAIGLLEGEAVACAGRLNWYRIRLVNDTPGPLDVELSLRGDADAVRPFELCSTSRLAARTAVELYLATDWLDRFETASERPPPDGVASLDVPAADRVCRVVARLGAAERVLDERIIIQPLAPCASST